MPDRVFDQEGAVFFYPVRQFDGPSRIEPSVALEDNLGGVSKGFPKCRHIFAGLLDGGLMIVKAVGVVVVEPAIPEKSDSAGNPFLGLIDELLRVGPTDVSIHKHLVPRPPAEKLIDRNTVFFAFYVPEGHVDTRQGRSRVGTTPIE